MKKNCFNCKNLTTETEQDSHGYELGDVYHCEKQYQKSVNNDSEAKYERNIGRKEYLEKGKVCFESNEQLVDLKCPDCGDVFPGWAHDQGTKCIDCYASTVYT